MKISWVAAVLAVGCGGSPIEVRVFVTPAGDAAVGTDSGIVGAAKDAWVPTDGALVEGASTDGPGRDVGLVDAGLDAYAACGLATSRDSCITCCGGLYAERTGGELAAYESALTACVCKFSGTCPSCAEHCAGFPAEGDEAACITCMSETMVAGGACVGLVTELCTADCSYLLDCTNEQCGGWPYPADGGKYGTL